MRKMYKDIRYIYIYVNIVIDADIDRCINITV